MTTELLNRVMIDDMGGEPYIKLIYRPELYCELRDALMKHLCARLRDVPSLEVITFNFGYGVPPELNEIVETITRADIDWPDSFKVTLTRRGGEVTVIYDDWSQNRHSVEAYRARLLSYSPSI